MKKTLALLGLSALAVATSATAAAEKSPQALYRSLLTTRFAGLPKGFYSAKVSQDDPSSQAKKHHAIGAVLVDVDSSDAFIRYLVFPTVADAAADWKDAKIGTGPGVKSTHVMGKAPGFRQPSLWVDATLEGKNAFGKTVRNGVTLLAVQRGDVIVESATISTDNETAGDMPGAIALLNAGLRHLAKVSAR